MDDKKKMKFNKLLEITSLVIVTAFGFNLMFVDYACANSSLRPATLGEDSARAERLKEKLQKGKTAVLDTEVNDKSKTKNKKGVVKYQLSPPQTLILYAEPLLENGGGIDLKDTLGVLITNNVLGTVVLYAERPVSASVLEKLIKEINPYLKIIRIMNEELLPDYSEVEELDALIKLAKANGIKQEDILCVLKGTVEKREALKKLAKERAIPILVFKGADGENLYSIAEVIQRSKAAQKMFTTSTDH